MTNEPFSAAEIEALLANGGKGFQGALGGANDGVAERALEKIMRSSDGQVRAYRSGPKRVRGISLSEEAWTSLQQIAHDNGLNWGGRGNVSELMELIGAGVFKVVR